MSNTAPPLSVGIYHDIAEQDYHARPEISKHGLDLIARSPMHYKADVNERTPAMMLGSATHCRILEPDLFDDQYAVLPEGIDRRTKAGKITHAEFTAENVNRDILTADQFHDVSMMQTACNAHPAAHMLLSDRNALREFCVIADNSGVRVRSRIDLAIEQLGVVVDLKTTKNAAAGSFSKDIVNFRYHVQAAFYLDNINAAIGEDIYKEFAIVAVEKTAPYGVAVYRIAADAIERGRELYQRDLKTYQSCMESDTWAGYGDGVQDITLPAWGFNDYEVSEAL